MCIVLIVLNAFPALIRAQESIGFADPGDIQPLLDYRLPDWGYRNWELAGSVDAAGDDDNPLDQHQQLFPQLSYVRYHESEGSIWRITGDLTGRINRNESPSDEVSRSLDGRITLSGRTDRYFRSSWFYSLNAGIGASYAESRRDELTRVVRDYDHNLGVGLGYGRLRDVDPLLRAKRISERLRALGRDPLPDRDVERLAEVIAQEGGYSVVFDRPDRHFWGAVFEILEAGQPFTAYEVLYLTEVMREHIGLRYEGRRLAFLTSWYRESSYDNRARENASLEYSWYHNHDLDHQLGLVLRGFWSWVQYPPGDERHGSVTCSLDHLWIVADRILWSNSISSDLMYDEYESGSSPRHRWHVILASLFSFYVEDRWSINPELATYANWSESADHDWLESWAWRFRVTVNYRFGAGIL